MIGTDVYLTKISPVKRNKHGVPVVVFTFAIVGKKVPLPRTGRLVQHRFAAFNCAN